MTASKFYKRGMIIAEQFDGSEEMVKRFGMHKFGTKDPRWDMQARPYGVTVVRLTDWIVTDVTEKSLRSITNANFQAQMVPLPVIPEAVGEYIKWGKTYGIPTYMMFSFKFVRGQGFSKLTDEVEDWIISNSDAFALACLLDDWEVEE